MSQQSLTSCLINAELPVSATLDTVTDTTRRVWIMGGNRGDQGTSRCGLGNQAGVEAGGEGWGRVVLVLHLHQHLRNKKREHLLKVTWPEKVTSKLAGQSG